MNNAFDIDCLDAYNRDEWSWMRSLQTELTDPKLEQIQASLFAHVNPALKDY